MRIIRDITRCPDNAKHSVLALGNFDGVHRGHQAILKLAMDMAAHEGGAPAVMTFQPHPRQFFAADHAPVCIYSFRQKAACITQAGIGLLFAARFNHALAATSAHDFVEHILHKSLGVRHVITGYNFAFGKGRAGDTEFLAHEGKRLGFGFTALPAIEEGDQVISTSAIRQALLAGDVARASHMLGHGYTISGYVQRGEQRGRTIGFPTANISLKHRYGPRYGVYVAKVRHGEQTHTGVANVGIKPTFSAKDPLLEVHLFDAAPSLYGQYIDVELCHFLREEQRFPSLEALQAQIAIDAQAARAFFTEGRHP